MERQQFQSKKRASLNRFQYSLEMSPFGESGRLDSNQLFSEVVTLAPKFHQMANFKTKLVMHAQNHNDVNELKSLHVEKNVQQNQ